VRWFEAVHFTTPLTMEYLANFKPPKHVLQEDIRLESVAKSNSSREMGKSKRVPNFLITVLCVFPRNVALV
jgi:hypothetical protein